MSVQVNQLRAVSATSGELATPVTSEAVVEISRTTTVFQ